jgi:ATP-binding cassette, subfamily C (CFTR/MRP), member 1
LSIRLEFLGGLLIMMAAINCVLLRDSLSAAAAGIAMAYALQITSQLNLMVRMATEMENSFNAVERIQVLHDGIGLTFSMIISMYAFPYIYEHRNK